MRYRDHADFAYTAEELLDIYDAVGRLETHFSKLPPATKAELRRLPHLGLKNETFSMEAIQAGVQNPQLMPPNINMAAIDRDRTTRETLLPIALRIEKLNEKVQISRRLLGADLFGAARAIYKALQEYGKDAGVGELLERLGTRFKSQGRRAATPPAPVN